MTKRLRTCLAFVMICLLQPALPHLAAATCDTLALPNPVFRADRGKTNRPYASPGDMIELRSVKPSDGHPDFGGNDPNIKAEDFVVSFIYKPFDKTEDLHTIFVAPTCQGVVDSTSTCGAVDTSRLACIKYDENRFQMLRNPNRLSVEMPGKVCMGLGGIVQECNGAGSCPVGTTCTELAGPLTIAVTEVKSGTAKRPCALAARGPSHRCRKPSNKNNSAVCIDRLCEPGSACSKQTIHRSFPSFTALPVANEYHEICTTSTGPCQGALTSELRFALDRRGNALLPFEWGGVRGQDKSRYVRTSSTISNGLGQRPIRLPGKRFVQSFNAKGRPLPALFDLEKPPVRPNELSIYGLADSPRSVLRVKGRFLEGRKFKECAAADPKDRTSCIGDNDCSGGAKCEAKSFCQNSSSPPTACTPGGGECGDDPCGVSRFKLADFVLNGVGPAVITRGAPVDKGICDGGSADDDFCSNIPTSQCPQCVSFRAETGSERDTPTLFPTPVLIASVVDETLIEHDLNGSGGSTAGHIATVWERPSAKVPAGRFHPMGYSASCPVPTTCPAKPQPCARNRPIGRAVAADPNSDPPHVIPVAGNKITFVEDCGNQPDCNTDRTRNYYLEQCTNSATGKKFTALIDRGSFPFVPAPAPLINRKAIFIAEHRVYARDAGGHLWVLDSRVGPQPIDLGLASGVAVRGDNVAFIRPKPGDLDAAVGTLHFWRSPKAEPILIAEAPVSDVSISDRWIAAAISTAPRDPREKREAREGEFIVHLRPLDFDTLGDQSAWQSLEQPGESLTMAGDTLVYLTNAPGEKKKSRQRLRIYLADREQALEDAPFAKDYEVDADPRDACEGDAFQRQLLVYRDPTEEKAENSIRILDLHQLRRTNLAPKTLLTVDLNAIATHCQGPMCGGSPYALRSDIVEFTTARDARETYLNQISTCDPNLLARLSDPTSTAVITPERIPIDPDLVGGFLAGRCEEDEDSVCFSDAQCGKGDTCSLPPRMLYVLEPDPRRVADHADGCEEIGNLDPTFEGQIDLCEEKAAVAAR